MTALAARLKTAPAEESARPVPSPGPGVEVSDDLRREIGPLVDADRRHGERRGPLRPGRLLTARARLLESDPAKGFRVADVSIIIAVAAIACRMGQPGDLLAAPVGAVLPYILGAMLLTWSLRATGAYGFQARETLSSHLLKTAAAFTPAAAILVIIGATRGAMVMTQGLAWLSLSFSAVYLAHLGWWSSVRRWRAEGRLTPNVVLVGATRNAERLIARLLDSREANVLGVFDDRLDRVPPTIRGVPVLGDTAALIHHRIMPFVDRIVVAVPASAQGRVNQIIAHLRVLPNEISLFLDFDGETGAATLSRLGDSPLAQLSGLERNENRAFWKRVQDLTIGSLALIVALPIMALTALAVRLDSPGPILFRQRRHGFNNEEIVVWKFRSMRQDAADATASRQVSADDDRITRVGRFIRRTSLDELPQIFNVLTGEMSLVGPRPHAIGMKTGQAESARLVAEYAHRHQLKPGMTGWAAIKGSRGPVDTPDSVRRRVALDVEYIHRQSFWLDLYIMLVTIPCLLGDRSAVR